MANTEQRAFARNQTEAPLQLKIPGKDVFAVNRLYNFCQEGVYFESHHPIEPDKETTIVMPDLLAESPTLTDYVGYRVQIRWCNKLQQKRELKYGVGARLLVKTNDLTKAAALLRQHSGCDFCGQKLMEGSICRINGTACLCLACYEKLEKRSSGPLKNSIWKFIDDRNIV